MKKILVIGASSAIAQSASRIWAKQGHAIFLVARNQERLDLIQPDLKVRGASEVNAYCLDLNDFNAQVAMLDAAYDALGSIDFVLIAHGTLSHQRACEASVDLTMQEIKTNALSVISLLTHLANRFEHQKSGVIGVISSVAGDRGRQSNYVYGSAKSMITTFASGFRQWLSKSGVSVMTIKPGFVDTPMTSEFKKGLLWASADQVADTIVKAYSKKNGEIYTPGFWWAIMLIIKHIPEKLFLKLKL